MQSHADRKPISRCGGDRDCDREVGAARFVWGPRVAELDAKVAAYRDEHGVVYPQARCVLLALMASRSVRDEVITTPFTFFATPRVARLGARPLF